MGNTREDPLKAFSEITIPDSIKFPQKCEWCQKPLPKRYVVHQNYSQDPPEHKFCSRICKDAWCKEQLKKK